MRGPLESNQKHSAQKSVRKKEQVLGEYKSSMKFIIYPRRTRESAHKGDMNTYNVEEVGREKY